MTRTRIVTSLLLLICASALLAEAPVVQNVTFSQRSDGSLKVDIYYDLSDADGDTLTITMQASNDNGATWAYACPSVSGDIGQNMLPGAGKHIVWDFFADHPLVSGAQFKIKIVANDNQGANIQWVTVAAGNYTYGSNDATQTIAYNYQIGKYAVTNAQYMAFLTAALAAGKITISGTEVKGDYPGDSQWAAGTYLFYTLRYSTSYNVGRIDYSNGNFTLLPNDTYLEHPVVCVTWFGAWAFADFYGYRLPTEQEWEKAARGNTGYDYPWGNSISGSRANYYQSGDPFSEGTTPVGYYNGQQYGSFQTTDSPSPYGAYDMAGNVWQWTNSFYGGSYPTYRVLRGGSWGNNTDDLRSWIRIYGRPTGWSGDIGFRCARTQ